MRVGLTAGLGIHSPASSTLVSLPSYVFTSYPSSCYFEIHLPNWELADICDNLVRIYTIGSHAFFMSAMNVNKYYIFFCELSTLCVFYVTICLFLVIDETNCNYAALLAVNCAVVKDLTNIP